jgi:hypothetical protein
VNKLPSPIVTISQSHNLDIIALHLVDADNDGTKDVVLYLSDTREILLIQGTALKTNTSSNYNALRFDTTTDIPNTGYTHTSDFDLNNDGNTDFYITVGEDIFIFRWTGLGSFNKTSFNFSSLTGEPIKHDTLIHYDYDGDGKLDLIVGNQESDYFYLIKNHSEIDTTNFIFEKKVKIATDRGHYPRRKLQTFSNIITPTGTYDGISINTSSGYRILEILAQ